MTTPTNVRFPEPVDRALADLARRERAPKSTIAVRAVSEWLRMQAHPDVRFITELTGERRAVLAAGPQVWTVAEAWLQHDVGERSARSVADSTGLTQQQVESALGYWADHRDEIDALIEVHRSSQDEALAAWERRRALNTL